jgi:hypothetical protein
MIKGIQSSLGLINFYQKFNKGFLQMAKLLSNLLKKEPSFKWKDEQQKEFEDLKEKFSSTPKLKFPNFTKYFKVHTNTSDFVISGVLMQDGHPNTFENKKLYGAQFTMADS